LLSSVIGGILVLFIYITRLASNEIFSLSNKIHREAGRAKDLSAPLYRGADKFLARPGRKQATATEDFEFIIGGILVLCVCVCVYIYIYIYIYIKQD